MIALYDAGAQARLAGDGPDLLPLLNRLSTGEVAGLQPGASAQTVVTTAKGRIVARLFVHRLDDGVRLIGGVDQGETILAHLARYTFAEKTGLEDRSARSFQWGLWGDGIEAMGLPEVAPGAAVSCGDGVWLLGHDGESTAARSIVGPIAERESWREKLIAAGACPTGAEEIARRRILAGIPVSGHELTEEFNPLEAGLREAVSFTKGCYVGQEVVARLENYDKVSRRLLGLSTDSDLPAGGELFVDGRKVGIVTSAAGSVALCFVKIRAAGPGDDVTIGASGPTATLVALPFSDAT